MKAFPTIVLVLISFLAFAQHEILRDSDILIGSTVNNVFEYGKSNYNPNDLYKGKDQNNDSIQIVRITDKYWENKRVNKITKVYYFKKDSCFKIRMTLDYVDLTDKQVISDLKKKYFFNGLDSIDMNPNGKRDVQVNHKFESPQYIVKYQVRSRSKYDNEISRGILILAKKPD